MPRKPHNRTGDKGRNFYETTSPWETQVETVSKPPKSYSGLVDQSMPLSSRLINDTPGPEVMRSVQPEQYDNPRGYPGMSLITSGAEKSKLGRHDADHSITHNAEGEAKLARTGK
jgi:hypothetical protein